MSGAMKAMVMTGYFGSECDGGFSEYTIIDARNVAAVHNPVGDAEPATFSCSHTTAEGRLRLWHVPLTSHATYYMADGKTCDTVETVVIAVETDTGLTGWGEVCPIPHYLPAYARGVAPALQELAPVILGADPVGAGGAHGAGRRASARPCLREIRARHRAVGSHRPRRRACRCMRFWAVGGRPTCRFTTRSPAWSPRRWPASPATRRPKA
jgi:hypothetical protein